MVNWLQNLLCALSPYPTSLNMTQSHQAPLVLLETGDILTINCIVKLCFRCLQPLDIPSTPPSDISWESQHRACVPLSPPPLPCPMLCPAVCQMLLQMGDQGLLLLHQSRGSSVPHGPDMKLNSSQRLGTMEA